jgi:hypothetical protein
MIDGVLLRDLQSRNRQTRRYSDASATQSAAFFSTPVR